MDTWAFAIKVAVTTVDILILLLFTMAPKKDARVFVAISAILAANLVGVWQ